MSDTKFIQVEDYPDLVRDMNSGAIINNNRNAYEKAKKRSTDVQRQRDELRNTTRELNILKSEMHEIKNLLKELVGRE